MAEKCQVVGRQCSRVVYKGRFDFLFERICLGQGRASSSNTHSQQRLQTYLQMFFMAYCLRFFQRRRRWLILFFCTLFICLCGPSLSFTASTSVQVQAQSRSLQQVANEGVARYEMDDFAGAIALWETALEQAQTNPPTADQATLLEYLARVHRRIGQTSTSLTYWESAVEATEKLGDSQQLGRLLSEQAQTYSQLGQYRKAIALLCGSHNPNACLDRSALSLAQTTQDTLAEASALGSLGEALRLQRDYDGAIAALGQSIAIAKSINQTTYQTSNLYSLGTVYTRKAQAQYRRAAFSQDRKSVV